MNRNYLNIPCLITFAGLFMSWLAIVFLINEQIYFSFCFLLLAFIFDIYDGYAARKLSKQTDFGTFLDSQVDAFTYLFFPALFFYLELNLVSPLSMIIIFIFLSSGIFRLARFNIGGIQYKKGHMSYSGMPVFMNLALILFLFFISSMQLINNKIIFHLFILLASILMVGKFSFPKPGIIWPFIVFILIIISVFIKLAL